MKPLYLEFKGINSFSEKTEIDFSKLCEEGLFGIFGKTGSGKSTILDCIMYALFSKTSRKQTLKEYLNDKSNDAYIKFVFEVMTSGVHKTYKVNKTLKLNKRGSIDTSAEMFEIKGEDVIPLCEGERVNEKVKEIIGIGYDEFARCIVLPQNEFAAFVKSSRAERFSSVSKLFGLEKYDILLGNKLKERIALTQNELAGVNGELKSYEQFTKEYLDEKRGLLEAEKARKSAIIDRLKAVEEKLKKDGELYSDKKKYIKNEEVVAELKNKEQWISLKKDALSKCENALSVISSFEELKKAQGELSDYNKKSEELSVSISDTEKALNSIIEEEKNVSLNELEKYISAQAILSANMSVVNKTDDLRNDYKKTNDSMISERKTLSSTDEKIKNIEEKLNKVGSPEKEFVSLIGRIGAFSLKEELVSEKEYFDEKLHIVSDYTGSDFGKAVFDEIYRKSVEISARINSIDLPETDVIAVSERIEKIRVATAKVNDLNLTINDLREKRAASLQKTEFLKKELERLADEGLKCKATLDGVENKTGYNVRTKEKASAALEEVNDKITEIKKKTERIAERKSSEEKKLTNYKNDLSVCEGKKAALREKIAFLSKKAEESLLQSKFTSEEEAKVYALDEKTLSLYNKEIKEFDEKRSEALAFKSMLDKLFAVCPFDEKGYEALLVEKDELAEKSKVVSENVAVFSKEYNDAVNGLEKCGEIRVKRDEIAAKAELLNKLSDVLYGRNLLEFIAEEYLSEISYNASRTLLLLTSGRYDLVYDGEFFVSDNLNCGNKRPVSTLSGGETFLVSLSLALSLSQAICEKTNKPVEFFFLDEGFGTLDEDLIEVVLDSLDKLRSSNFTIGLISHVVELKQRIQSKILVSPATASHGSTAETVC